ncbi:HSP20-like chaperone [Anaeromyces robustus]|uniref:HSP20-like chaperone n=1 Tax=Anaeromyces robustus TaxID=1754192 RepID=A0A1Y1X2W1_9FUNG|nr:HSP20-like chaperone [Anaeromyces robustus]|eukprot:ORX79995.1 HSP20-like chaperone [Anaeromyces robustus]
MSLFIRENPLTIRNNHLVSRNSLFDDLENEFFNYPLISFPSVYPYYYSHPMESLEKQISKVFNSDVFKSVDFSPKINLSEDEKNYYIHADLPGMNKDQVKMELSDDDRILTISGERETIIDNSNKDANANKEASKEETKKEEINKKEETKKEVKKENNKKYSKIECSYGKFSRSFTLPENANLENIQAKMDNGVLEVTINKKEETPKPEPKHSIQIQ